MLRAVRFSAQLGFSIEETTLRAMQHKSADIAWIAKERLKAELDKLWVGKDVYNGIKKLQESDLDVYLPGDFHAENWRGFCVRNKLFGWAYFAYMQGENGKMCCVAIVYRIRKWRL